MAGNPLTLADGVFRNRWDPTWHDVSDHIDAIHYFHFRGTFLFDELLWRPQKNPDDPRLVRLELRFQFPPPVSGNAVSRPVAQF